jgi:hypothetical protein
MRLRVADVVGGDDGREGGLEPGGGVIVDPSATSSR